MARVVLFGATGYTGGLTAQALVQRGVRPLLAGRSAAKLEELAEELGGDLDIAVADALRPSSVRDLLEPGDVLISTAGPFLRWGETVAQAAIEGRAHYLDSNGEPPFTRRIFEGYGAAASQAGVGVLTAFGWECVPGNLAGALALHEAGDAAVRVDTGYFYGGTTGFSGGTRASFAEAMIRPSFAFRDGAIREVRAAERFRTMPVEGRRRPGVGFGASEHFALPRSFPQLREVNAYLGWFGGLSPRAARLIHAAGRVGSPVLRVPGARRLAGAAIGLLKGSSGGPSREERAAGGIRVVAIAYDAAGEELAEVSLAGIEGYELTAALLAWGAERTLNGGLRRSGALGPVEAFGLDELEAGCREAGVARLRYAAG